jgi:hypothetical protein
MRASKEAKRVVSIMRSRHGKRNGVVPCGCFDSAIFIWKHYDRKRKASARDDRKIEAQH